MCVQGVSGGKKCSFFGKFSVLCFLETLVLRFGLLPYYSRFNQLIGNKCPKFHNRLSGSYFFKLTLVSDCLEL